MSHTNVEKWQREARRQFPLNVPYNYTFISHKELDTLISQIIADTERATVDKIKELVAYSSFNCDAGGRVSERHDSAKTVCHEINADLDKMFPPPPQETELSK